MLFKKTNATNNMNSFSDESSRGFICPNNNGSHSKKKDNLRYSRCEENHDEQYEYDEDVNNRYEELKVIDFDQANEVTSVDPFLSSKNNIKQSEEDTSIFEMVTSRTKNGSINQESLQISNHRR